MALLPFDKAVEQLHGAIQSYDQAVGRFNKDRTRDNWQKLVAAYSKLSSAQWELEQVAPRPD